MSNNKCLVVLSGGQDSVTCLALAKTQYEEVHAITFNYGQRHKIEIDAAVKACSIIGVASHEIVDVPSILGGKSFLTDLTAEVQSFENFEDMEHHNAFKDNKLDSSFVPMRNQLFLTIAANRAYVLGCDALITGITAADFAEYGDFSWAWLGGFVDAEGCINKVNGNGYRLSFSQKDPELMHRIGNWIKNQYPDFTYGLSTNRGCDEMTIGKKAYELISSSLTPHIHSEHRREQAKKHGAWLFNEAPMEDAWMVGFWEGDGGVYSAYGTTGSKKQYVTRSFEFIFYQKHPEILERIQSYLGAGHLNPVKDDAWVLKVSDGPQRAKLLGRMRKHFNILHSFKKIDKSRHKIGLAGNGFNPPYPDCTPDFLHYMQIASNEALRVPGVSPIRIEAPLMYLSKAQSVRLAQTLPGCMTALSFSHTAYDGKYPPNGNDHATLLRAKGFRDAGVADPLVVRAAFDGLMELPDSDNYTQERANKAALDDANDRA